MTNGGVMIGRTESTRSARFQRNRERVTMSAKASPRAVQPSAQSSASTSVFHATPQRVAPRTQPTPQILRGREARDESGGRERAVGILHCLQQDHAHGIEGEHRDERDHRHHAARDERLALEVAAPGKPLREQHRERAAHEACAEAHSELPWRADEEALREEVRETCDPEREQGVGARPPIEGAHRDQGGGGEQDADRGEPRLAVARDLHYRRPVVPARPVTQPRDAEHRVLQRVPRDEKEADRSRGKPSDEDSVSRNGCSTHFAAALTSFSHRSRSRFRVSLAPYLAKS